MYSLSRWIKKKSLFSIASKKTYSIRKSNFCVVFSRRWWKNNNNEKIEIVKKQRERDIKVNRGKDITVSPMFKRRLLNIRPCLHWDYDVQSTVTVYSIKLCLHCKQNTHYTVNNIFFVVDDFWWFLFFCYFIITNG